MEITLEATSSEILLADKIIRECSQAQSTPQGPIQSGEQHEAVTITAGDSIKGLETFSTSVMTDTGDHFTEMLSSLLSLKILAFGFFFPDNSLLWGQADYPH